MEKVENKVNNKIAGPEWEYIGSRFRGKQVLYNTATRLIVIAVKITSPVWNCSENNFDA